MVLVFPTFKIRLFLLSFGDSTVTLQVYFFLPTFAVIVAEPDFLAVTFPEPLTVATDFLLEVHFVFPFVPDNFSFKVCPVSNVALFLLIFPAADTGTAIQTINSMTARTDSNFFTFFIHSYLPIIDTHIVPLWDAF